MPGWYKACEVVTLMDTDDNLSKRALLGMVSFYKAVIKYLQDNLPLDNELLKALTCLNPREQNSSKSKEYCNTVASAMPCITGDEKVKGGDEWIRYQEIEKLMMMTFKDTLIISGTGSSIFLTNVEIFFNLFLKW